jgi:tRNA (cytidine/uridine-2'-O-)-methyltransferase
MSAALTLALFEPDIPQNTGTMLRMCACLGIDAALIEPAAFSISDPRFRRAAMDYLEKVRLRRHASWQAFLAWRAGNPARLILLTTRAPLAYTELAYARGDILLVGRESAGVPDGVHDAPDARVRVPMRPDFRSLNVAIAAAMVVGEALRQTRGANQDASH